MLKRVNKLEKQYGGAIPFSALEDKKIKKTKKKSTKKSPKKSPPKKKHKKRSVSPARIHRKNTRKLKRSKKQTIRENRKTM